MFKPWLKANAIFSYKIYQLPDHQQGVFMRLVIIATSLLLLTACTDSIWMKNPTTGQTVDCGQRYVGLAKDFKMEGTAAQEGQCISDYKEQGFVRVPNAK